jgi:hypothetical protein
MLHVIVMAARRSGRLRRSLFLVTWSVGVGCSTGGEVGTGSGDAGPRSEGGSGSSSGGSSDGSSPTDSSTGSDTSSGSGDGNSSNAPPQAAAVGYTMNTFTSTFVESTIDTSNTQKTGYAWYLGQFFGGSATPASDLTFNNDGTLSLDGAGTSANAGINTATPSTNAAGWAGVAFGGGAYFEAIFEFNPQQTINANGKGWPAWWAMAIEHLAGLPTEQWQGQPSGYSHFIETDFFEYDVWSFSPHNEYGGAMHDWYGVWNQTCGSGYCSVSNSGGGSNFDNFQVQTPPSTDFTQYHAFGFLWVPATGTTKGYAQYYFDGQPTNDKVAWSKYAPSDTPPPGTAGWTFGVLDQQHVVLILGTGKNEPMTLRSVNVWQASTANNVKN